MKKDYKPLFLCPLTFILQPVLTDTLVRNISNVCVDTDYSPG